MTGNGSKRLQTMFELLQNKVDYGLLRSPEQIAAGTGDVSCFAG